MLKIMDIDRTRCVKNLRYLWAAGNLYAKENPKLSRYLISKFHKLSPSSFSIDGQDVHALYCQQCFSLLRPGNHTVRIAPKRHITKQIVKHRASQQHGTQSLGKSQKEQLKRWENSQAQISLKCASCQCSTKTPGSKRFIRQPQREGRRQLTAKRKLQQQQEVQQSQRSTPAASTTPKQDFATRQSRLSSHHTSPILRSPMGSTPSGTLTASARKARHLQKQKHQQLRKMLDGARREKANSGESPLKDFLVSLPR